MRVSSKDIVNTNSLNRLYIRVGKAVESSITDHVVVILSH